MSSEQLTKLLNWFDDKNSVLVRDWNKAYHN